MYVDFFPNIVFFCFIGTSNPFLLYIRDIILFYYNVSVSLLDL